MIKYPCIESTVELNTKFLDKEVTIRLWINEDRIKDRMSNSLLKTIEQLRTNLLSDSYVSNISSFVEEVRKVIPNLSALQVIDTYPKDGVKYGTVIYTIDF